MVAARPPPQDELGVPGWLLPVPLFSSRCTSSVALGGGGQWKGMSTHACIQPKSGFPGAVAAQSQLS